MTARGFFISFGATTATPYSLEKLESVKITNDYAPDYVDSESLILPMKHRGKTPVVKWSELSSSDLKRIETRLRWFREANDISLRELEKSSGIEEETLSKLEDGFIAVSPDVRARLNHEFGGEAWRCDWLLKVVTLHDFLEGEVA